MRYVAGALTGQWRAAGTGPAVAGAEHAAAVSGLCGHCQLREYLVCVDGPVLPLDAVRARWAVREL